MASLLRIKLFNVDIGPYKFSPGLIPTIVTVFFVGVMLFMGDWQYSKAQYKDDLVAKIEERKNYPPVSIDELPRSYDERLYQPIYVTGKYDAERYFLLDNKILNGRVGFDVFSPLKLSDGRVILVNRGFVENDGNRAILPKIETPINQIKVTGLLDKTPPTGIILSDYVNEKTDWPIVLQYIDFEEIKALLGVPVFDMILRLDKDEPHGYEREIPALSLNSAKNYGYAFQWVAMTLALIIIYIAVNTTKRDKK